MSKKITIPILVLFALVFLLSTILNGFSYSFGLGFWNAHGHDAIWHLAVINQFAKSVPPPNPVFSGHLLSGYHWGFDFLVYLVHRFTSIPTINLYFQIFPILITISLIVLSLKLKPNHIQSGLLFVFLNFFAGSFGYLVTLIKDGQIGGESLFWSMQSISTLINPPYALSVCILLLALYFYNQSFTKNSTKFAVFAGILFGLNTIIKIYASILSGLVLLTIFVINFLKSKKILSTHFFTLVSMGIVSLAFLLILNVSSSTLIFKPFWFVNSLIDAHDKLYLPQISSLRFNLENQFNPVKLPVLLSIYLVSFFIFLIGNLGTRVFCIPIIITKFKSKKISPLDRFLFLLAFFSLTIPMLFVQKGTAWNTIQFFYYFLIVTNFYFADFLKKIYSNKKLYFFLLILLTIPTTISTIRSFIGFPPPSCLPSTELQALNFLKSLPDGIVLTYPFQSTDQPTPIPLYRYQTSAYVSAFSNKISYVDDYVNLDITNYDWSGRLKDTQYFFSQADQYQAVGFLLNNNIDYIYLLKDQLLPQTLPTHQIASVYSQSGINIYKVLK